MIIVINFDKTRSRNYFNRFSSDYFMSIKNQISIFDTYIKIKILFSKISWRVFEISCDHLLRSYNTEWSLHIVDSNNDTRKQKSSFFPLVNWLNDFHQIRSELIDRFLSCHDFARPVHCIDSIHYSFRYERTRYEKRSERIGHRIESSMKRDSMMTLERNQWRLSTEDLYPRNNDDEMVSSTSIR